MQNVDDFLDREIAAIAHMMVGRREAVAKMKPGDPGCKLAWFNLEKLEQELDALLKRRNELVQRRHATAETDRRDVPYA